MAWTEPVVLMLIDVRRAHFNSAARRMVFVEYPAEASAGKGKVVVCSGVCTAVETLVSIGKSRFARL